MNVIITIVVLVPMEILRLVMDEQTLGQTFGNVLSGIMVSALASAMAFGIVSLGTLALGTFVAVPAGVIVAGTIIVGAAVNVALEMLGVKSTISGLISTALDQAVQRLAEEEAQKARGQMILGQFYHDNPGFSSSPWRGLVGPRW